MSVKQLGGDTELREGFFEQPICDSDPAVDAALRSELARQQDQIELIASENIVSRAVLEAAGSVLTNKYAEGYPGRRYYGGCEFVDVAEALAIERAKTLFGCAFANVQPHSGAQANAAVYFALCKPGDTILGLSLAAGGHLTHGAAPNLSGKWFDAVQYGVREDDGRIDMDEVARLAREHRPRVIVAGGSAYPRIIDFAAFREIADEVDACLFVDMAHFAGLVAGGVHPSPLPHAHVVATTTHKTLRGPRGGMVLTDDEAIARKINSAIFPGTQGGPLMHIVAAKAVALGEALRPSFPRYAAAVVENARTARADPARRRSEHRVRRYRHASDAGRPQAEGADRQDRRAEPRAGRHHLQQERGSVRSGEADRNVGSQAGIARGDHPRIRPGGVCAGRRADPRSARRARLGKQRQRPRRDLGAPARARPVRSISDIPPPVTGVRMR